MEVGYAAGKKVPIIGVVTDFIWYASRSIPVIEYTLDPVLLKCIGKLLVINKLPPSKLKHTTRLLKDMLKIKDEYLWRSSVGLENAINCVSEEVYFMVKGPWDYVPKLPFKLSSNYGTIRIYLEFGGGMYEWQREYMKRIKQELPKKSDHEILFSRRHDPSYQKEMYEIYGEKAVDILGNEDLKNAILADIVVTCGDENEMNSGTAAIHGLSRALNKKLIMYYSGNMKIVGEGHHEMIKNLMLQYSSDIITTSLSDTVRVIKLILEGKNICEQKM